MDLFIEGDDVKFFKKRNRSWPPKEAGCNHVGESKEEANFSLGRKVDGELYPKPLAREHRLFHPGQLVPVGKIGRTEFSTPNVVGMICPAYLGVVGWQTNVGGAVNSASTMGTPNSWGECQVGENMKGEQLPKRPTSRVYGGGPTSRGDTVNLPPSATLTYKQPPTINNPMGIMTRHPPMSNPHI